METSVTNSISLECRDQPIQKVVVFNDRAELKRLVKVNLLPGVNEISLKNITQNVMHDSVRVDGRGDAIIHEVLLQNKPVTREESDSPKVIALRAVVEEKKKIVHQFEDKKSILEKRIAVLDKVVGEVGSGVVNPKQKEGSTSFILDNTTLDNLTKFFGFYDESSMKVRTEHRTIVDELEAAQRELNKAESDLQLATFEERNVTFSNIVSIILESKAGGDAELDVIYQVYGANWRPSYDMRVETSGKKGLKITYFGNVTQNTNEDWNEAPLVLSTAQPCLGGHIPELGTLEAVFYKPPPPVCKEMSMRTCGAPQMMMKRAMVGRAVEECSMSSAPMEHSRSNVNQHALSSEFVIARASIIPSDGAEHKVTIGIADLSPQLVHECVPSKNTSTFLTASAVNTSELPFIPGDASVYLNNSFVAKTQLKAVSPGERFACSLGVDTAIRVEYKPVKKYHEQFGLINKSSSTVHEQIIKVKNTRADPIIITVKENIPRSTDEKIKIRILAPSVQTPSSEDVPTDDSALPRDGPHLSSSNHLEWTLNIKGGSSQDLLIKWAVDHPKEEKIEFVEKF